ncbi:proto-oncogene tyrosine-protein kinase receptor Ret [Nephila pilipes]|uniref:Proto-oncogene tyrosine-protein kinase receptor Ret n=1 Tax=Nephila pilipes TaxID=299642 RepID=A0A8X6U6G6_NEPPI|nr:proto-oncogene tyrosine-protein kinase receptor Ret [Nephila pilipes]
MKILITVLFVLFICGRGSSIIFLQKTATLLLPYDYPVGTTFYRLQPLDEKTGKFPDDPLNFHLLKSIVFLTKSKFGRGLFVVDEHTGSLMLSPHRKHSISDKYLEINDIGKLTMRSSFDFEEAAHHEWNISCKVRSNGDDDTFYALVKIVVLDVDDNPPFIQNGTETYEELEAWQVSPGKPLPVQFTVLDRDSPSVNKIIVRKTDPLHLFNLRDPVIFHGIHGAHMLVNTALVPKPQFQFPDSSYNVSVIFDDVSLVNSDENGQIVFHVVISNSSSDITQPSLPPDEFQVVTNLFRHSAHHTRVIQPMEVKPHEGFFFRLIRDPNQRILSNRIFGVTPKTGIVYILDEVALSRSTNKLFRLELTWRNRNVTDRRCIILVRVLDSGESRSECGVEPGHQFPTCAMHGTAEACSTSCGRGANGGYCQWRSQSFPTLAEEYATCSPHLQTCPDGICDELEELDPLLCPQDCADNVQGQAVPGDHGKGIGKSAAPCTCNGPNTCICTKFFPPPKPASRSQTKTYKETPNIKSRPLELSENWGGCGSQCITMIVVVSLIVSGLVITAGILTYRRWISHSKDDELPGITTPLNSSTYLVARGAVEYPVHQSILRESKMEFPRDQLVLEEIIGEGEFGKVMKGKAKNIANTHGTTTVAVKMLKDGSCPSEKRDLISELNLLKEISHPNVIRLLGASTDDNGQLYIIMEYAEHGSLITYLRKLKVSSSEVNLLELIAFALQIAKGMNYLASMKVVHRDLAARNVLVASGKVLKISDFGLSRDVYEGDTYLKTSKSRVPVKWMALESLENQLYTTKSDVWSFGILMWEIITVGGCPYPGIPTERLFQLLKDGYRMAKPENCPLEVYEIMKSCWLEKPSERPHFKELVYKIESILEDISHQHPKQEENVVFRGKRLRSRDDGSMLQQLTSFPKLNTQQIGPYENQCLLSSNEFSV